MTSDTPDPGQPEGIPNPSAARALGADWINWATGMAGREAVSDPGISVTLDGRKIFSDMKARSSAYSKDPRSACYHTLRAAIGLYGKQDGCSGRAAMLLTMVGSWQAGDEPQED